MSCYQPDPAPVYRRPKDPSLRDNPPSERPGPGYGGQLHVHDENHADVHAFLRGIRAVLDEARRVLRTALAAALEGRELRTRAVARAVSRSNGGRKT